MQHKGLQRMPELFRPFGRHKEVHRWKVTVALIAWIILLLIGIFASSITALLHLSSLQFSIVPAPYWPQFYWMDLYSHLNSPAWWLTKFGHLVGFGIMELLMTFALRRTMVSSLLTFLFACGTELLQIPFGRDGRLYDVCIDTCGIVLFGLFYSIRSTRHS